MAINPLKAFLFAGGGVVAVAGAAYVSGALDPVFHSVPPARIAALEPADPATAPGTGDRLPASGSDAAVKPASEAPATANPPAEAAAPVTQAVVPSFDVVRVEGDGSVVIAGSAAPRSKVEALTSGTVLGSTDAGPDGAFAIVLDTPLKPGDYQITLRSTSPDNVSASSPQTAVVSIPQKPDGQVLAMVEEPGKPAELLNVPKPATQPDTQAEAVAPPVAQPVEAAPAPQAVPAETKPAEIASAPAETTEPPVPAKPAPAAAPAPMANVVVEAVEIDGSKIFVAGTTEAGRKVRAYANEILLGDAKASPDGHFLVEATRDLPVGTYTVRVDVLDADGAKVVARATVPFEREPGEAIAAVAPTTPVKPAAEQAAETAAPASSPPAGETKPVDVAATATPADGVPQKAAPKLEHADSAVIIRRHDTLWRISRRVYGQGIRYSTIYLANQDQISDPDRIWPGQVFKLPEKSREGEPADLKVLGDQMTTAPAKTK